VAQKARSAGAWTYPQLAQAYSLTGLYAKGDEGAGTRVALFELDPWSATDVAQFQACYGTHVPVRAVNIDGGAGPGPGSGEAALDIDTIIGLAPHASITVYDAPDHGLKSDVDEFTRIIDANSAQVLSISYGLCEALVSRSIARAEYTLFEQAAAQGMSVLASSGDQGSEGCYGKTKTHPTQLSPEDPASQPFVTGVGGTSLTAISPGPVERVWNDGVKSGSGAGGGGISALWAMPAWQYGPGTHNSLSSRQPCGASRGYCREVPDVSASADPRHGYVIRWKGKWLVVGGTSAATPLWAALIADIDSANGGARAGFLNPVLYAAARSGSGDFHDITAGNNDYTGSHHGTYPATAHYDMASGLGTPIATGLAATLARAASLVSFTSGSGTSAPPTTVGPYAVTAFSSITCQNGAKASSVTGPRGAVVGFSPVVQCQQVGDGWPVWANGYGGDVYSVRHPKRTGVTLTLPPDTRAFYLYAAPQTSGTFSVQATAQDGTVSGPFTVTDSDSGPGFFGFSSGSPSGSIKTITITCTDDFAVGEFGLAAKVYTK
jgi:subtilase family serine protease